MKSPPKKAAKMVSPVPKNLRTENETKLIPERFRNHVVDIHPKNIKDQIPKNSPRHPAKFTAGIAIELVRLSGSKSIGDPMAGTGTLARANNMPMALNDLDKRMSVFFEPLVEIGCEVSFVSANKINWSREVCIFSPPYYPRTDRKKPNAHDDEKRGPVVGFRDSYACQDPMLIGNPGGSNAILSYRESMLGVYSHMTSVCQKMILVTKNWTRLGVELRLDLDTILMAMEAGWSPVARHGWQPPPSLWGRFNANRGGGVSIEDILIFEKI